MGENITFDQDRDSLFPRRISQVGYNESGEIEIYTDKIGFLIEPDLDFTSLILDSDEELGEYFDRYVAGGWRRKHPIPESTRSLKGGTA